MKLLFLKSSIIKTALIILWIISCINTTVIAQDSTVFKSKHLFGIYSGYSNHKVKDDIISPLVYKGASVPIGLVYANQKTKSMQFVSLSYDKATLKSSISNSEFSPYTNNLSSIIGYSYNRKIFSSLAISTDFYLGGKLLFEISYRDHFYNHYFNEISGEQLSSIGLNFMVIKNFRKPNDKIYFSLNIPIVAYSVLNNRFNTVVGNATENYDKDKGNLWQIIKNGELITLNSLQEVQFAISYTKFFSKKIGLLARYYLHYYKIVQYEDTFYSRHLNYQINVGLIFKIENK